MPPLFTSTSLTTLLRSVAGAAKRIQPHAMARAPHRTITHINKARNAVHKLAHQTFPSLATPSHQLYQPTTIRAGARFASTQGPSVAKSARPFGAVGRGLQAGKRPHWGHGRFIPSNVGLGTARGFASGPASGIHAQVPMGLRAFASLLDDDCKVNKTLPRASRYSPYTRKAGRHTRKTCKSIDSSFIADLHHYFPLITVSVEESEIPLPPTPETLTTADKTTVLSLPLSPSLEALLHPTSELTYSETSVGVHILARLTTGILPIHSAFSLHSSTRILPLLNKLESLGVLEFHPGSPLVHAEVLRDADGQPDILRLVFQDRSVGDVRELLGESLRKHEEGEWWALWEERKEVVELSQGERKEMMEQWSEQSEEREVDELVMPTLDVSALENPTSPSSDGISTPLSGDLSVTSSLFSHLGDSEDWSIPPSSVEGSEVESAYAGSDSWGSVNISVVGSESESSEEGGVSVWWAGAGEGFGFVAQPW
ncbi:hypothetical protein L202_02906 [Cryptococcus amylolentus CBS 6039]|uniref:Uncharacterized protein n=1 Tax=Cryptococcus amylolentus CBS 6039 TaxID=1295533 RepID=A0A1E3HWR1_9TREE|nr:hypothetical protein L202_02906 [Cryptococcus amylolentus CBS 6039]ODN80750.1 hypothetical protein L202_02906 [Cryptococcus amylolentus CBS 6039]